MFRPDPITTRLIKISNRRLIVYFSTDRDIILSIIILGIKSGLILRIFISLMMIQTDQNT